MVEQMHTLIIDIGNSNVKYHWRGLSFLDLESLKSSLEAEIQVFVVSVSDSMTEEVLANLAEFTELQNIKIFDPNIDKPLTHTYLGLGSDRIVKAAGALLLNPFSDLVLMDFGTATTLTICTREFKFVKGLIHLGFQSYLNAVGDQCSSLRQFMTFDSDQFDYKQESSPQQAILEAALREHFALINDDLLYARELLGSSNIITIATGGLAYKFADKFDKYIDSRILLESYVTKNLSMPL